MAGHQGVDSGGGSLTVQDEGTNLTTAASTLNFTVEAIIMFIQYEKETRKITGYQTMPVDVCIMFSGLEEETGKEFLTTFLDNPERVQEVKDFYAAETPCEYATNGHIKEYVEAGV